MDGHGFPLYPYHTTAPNGVEATPHVLRGPTTEGWNKLLDFSPRGVSQASMRYNANVIKRHGRNDERL